MKQLVEQGNMFSDVSIQVRYGTGVKYEHVNWHVDGFNSMLHMALSLKGKRKLYAKKVEEDSSSNVYCNKQMPGDVYLSSPAAFMHAVGHNTFKRKDRIVAVQCRILMTTEDNENIHSECNMKPEDRFGKKALKMGERKALDNIAKLLEEQTFALPTLKEINNDTPTSITELYSK